MWVWSLLLVFSCDRNQPSLVNGIPRKKIHDNSVLFGGPVFKELKSVWRKPLPAFAVFQLKVLSAQSNQYSKAAYFGVSHPDLKNSLEISRIILTASFLTHSK